MVDIMKITRKIAKSSKTAESYGTGLLGEHIIVASYSEMNIHTLEKMRYIINKLIKKKKEMKRVSESMKKE